MKTLVIFHSVDLDGWMSAAIVKAWYNTLDAIGESKTIDFVGYNYIDTVPDVSAYDQVIMCDISLPKEDMEELWSNPNVKAIWIDHHISAIEENKGLAWPGMQDVKLAACELTWLFFFSGAPMPEIVRLLGRYDCFGHKGTEEEQKVLEFQYGARMHISNTEEAFKYLQVEIDNPKSMVLKIIHSDGKAIYQYLCTEAKQSYKNGFEVNFHKHITPTGAVSEDRYKFICINKERFNPINFGINYHKEGYDGAACFHYANGWWNFSLYNDNGEVDVSEVAKRYGGGGHKGAAGFRAKDISEILK